MKANKRFITVLLAVLTIFVLVPTMAFAASAGKIASWGDKYATVLDDNDPQHSFDTVRVFGSDGVGLVTAVAQDDTAIAGDTYPAPQGSDGVATAYFYDFDGSAFVYQNGGKWVALDGAKMTQAFFEGMTLGVQVVEQDYVKTYTIDKNKYDADKALKAEFSAGSTWKAGKNAKDEDAYVAEIKPAGYTFSIETSEYVKDSTKDQTIEVSIVKTKADGTVLATPTKSNPDLIGTVAKATVTVKAKDKTPATAGFFMDEVDGVWALSGSALVGRYDGAAHTVVCDEVPGYTVSYEVKNASTGKYEKVDAVSITDVQKDALEVKATFTNAKTKATEIRTFTVNLAPAAGTKVGFDADASIQDGVNWYAVEGSEYNATDYIAVTPNEIDPIAKTEPARTEDTAKNAAYKAAVEANSAQILAWFNEKYDIEATPTKADPNKVDLKIKEKNLSAKEAKALNDKYEQLLQNMGGTITVDTAAKARVFLNNAGVLAPEIEFIDSPTAMKFKAKKLKKKAASFTVTAVSSNNEPVTYKLINAPAKIKIDKATGMITLAKKIKKGTYKITVKAYLPKAYQNNNGGIWYPSETHNIKIKVK